MSAKEFEAALEAYKGEIREAYNFGFNEETNAVNLAVKAARWARAHVLAHDPVVEQMREALEMYQIIADSDCRPYEKQREIGRTALAALEKARGEQ